MHLEELAPIAFEYTKLMIDEDHHVRLVCYEALEDDGGNRGLLSQVEAPSA